METVTPKKAADRSALQAPYRISTLMPASSFETYCRENDIRMDTDELEKFHECDLLIPAMRIEVGIAEMRKARIIKNGNEKEVYVEPDISEEQKNELGVIKMDEQPYYVRNGFFIRPDKDWLSEYRKYDAVHFPAEESFSPWKEFSDEFSTNPEDADGGSVYLYDKRQLLALRMIKQSLRRNMTMDERGSQHLRERIAELYHFLRLYIEVEEHNEQWNRKRKREKYREFLGETQKAWIAVKDWTANFKAEQLPKLRKEAETIAGKYSFTAQDIKKWRRFLIEQSIFDDQYADYRRARQYLRRLDGDALINGEDCLYMVHILNRFIYLLTGEEQDIYQTMRGISNMENILRCKVCGTLFTPLSHITNAKCCSHACIKKYKREYSRQWRKKKKIATPESSANLVRTA